MGLYRGSYAELEAARKKPGRRWMNRNVSASFHSVRFLFVRVNVPEK